MKKYYVHGRAEGSRKMEIRELGSDKLVGALGRLRSTSPWRAYDLNDELVEVTRHSTIVNNPGMLMELIENSGYVFPEKNCPHPVASQHKDGCGDCGAWVAARSPGSGGGDA